MLVQGADSRAISNREQYTHRDKSHFYFVVAAKHCHNSPNALAKEQRIRDGVATPFSLEFSMRLNSGHAVGDAVMCVSKPVFDSQNFSGHNNYKQLVG